MHESPPDTARASISSLLSKSSNKSTRSSRSRTSRSSKKSSNHRRTKLKAIKTPPELPAGTPTRYDALVNPSSPNTEQKKKKRGVIKDERLRKINAGATGKEFLTNLQLEELGDELISHARHARTDEALEILKGDVDADRRDWKHFFWTVMLRRML